MQAVMIDIETLDNCPTAAIASIGTARAVARRELARLRSEYSETLPVGRRVVWGQA